MGIEQKVSQKLNNYPTLKKVIKRAYQRTSYQLSDKIKYEGNIRRLSPDDKEHEYFFGYYDKSPWDKTDRYVLCLKAKHTHIDVAPKEEATIIVIDTKTDKYYEIATTRTWNVQQGCMLQWLGDRVLYNDLVDGRYSSVILELDKSDQDLKVVSQKIIPAPVYSVSKDEKFALTLDFSRLHRLRPGYGYSNIEEITKNEDIPEAPCIYRVDLETSEVTPILYYEDFYKFETRKEMVGAKHKVNHIMISPNSERFMILHRWINKDKKYSRLITCNVDGTDMYNLSDDDMVSHCTWKDDQHIFAFLNKKNEGQGYYLLKDKTQEYERYWHEVDYDGHPSFSPDLQKVVFDRYPNKYRMASIYVSHANNRFFDKVTKLASVFAPFKYDNDTRCDLHPRWNRASTEICFDSVFEGSRGLYSVKVPEIPNPEIDLVPDSEVQEEFPKYTIITPVYNSFNLMEKYFETLENQSYKNFEVIIVDDSSTDNSYSNLLNYAENSKLDIRIFKTEENSGPGVARNIAIKNARGKYITFIDNDDWVHLDLLKKADRIIRSYDLGVLVYDYYITNGKSKSISRSMYFGESGKISISHLIAYIRNHSIGKFYKLEYLRENNILYPDLKKNEDVGFVCRAVSVCKDAYYLKEPLYYYYQRPNSLSNNNKMDHRYMLEAFEILEKDLSDTYYRELEEKSVADLLYGALLIMCKSKKSTREIYNYIKEYEKKYPNWYNSEIIKHMSKAKVIFLKAAKKKNIPLLRTLAFVHSKLIG